MEITKEESWRMFDAISKRYDLINRLLTGGLDLGWRRKLAEKIPQQARTVLDLATGTGDVLLAISGSSKELKDGYGVDLSSQMLEVARKKIRAKGEEGRLHFQKGDAHQLPFPDKNFDAVTIAFGIRNMRDPKKVLREMHRVLKPGGRAVILEASQPARPFIRFFYLFYLRSIVPLIGFIVSGNYAAYRYLNKTIESFPYGEAFCQILREEGFQSVAATELLFGTTTIYQADKS